MTQWAYEVPGGVIHVIDDGALQELAVPVGTVLCRDGTTDHRWGRVEGGLRCSRCETAITALD